MFEHNIWTNIWTVVLEKTFESPLDCKEIQPVHPKGDQSWVFIVGADVEAETLVLWPPDAESWLIWKNRDAGKDWGQEEKGTTEDEMVGWHRQHDGHGFGWTPGVGDGQEGLACCGSRGRRVGHNWATELNWFWITKLYNCSPKKGCTPVHTPNKMSLTLPFAPITLLIPSLQIFIICQFEREKNRYHVLIASLMLTFSSRLYISSSIWSLL